MLLDAPDNIRGLQIPPISSLPDVESSAGDEAIELAEQAGLVLDPWQRYVLKRGLSESPNGKWAAFEVAVVLPRQNGKGAILEARELAGLYLFGEDLLLHSAHEFKTAEEAFRRILALIENNASLSRRVKNVRTSHGQEGIELKSGQRLRFIARSRSSGRGFSGDCVILDEAMILDHQAMGALLPTMSARPNPQLWYTSSAGNEASTQLARVVRRGRAGNDRSLAYFEWTIGDDDPRDDPETWAKANPALGIRLSTEYIAKEMAALEDTEFARERLGVGTYPTEDDQAEWQVIDEPAWNAALDISSQMGNKPVVLAIDVTPDRSRASVGVAGYRPDGLKNIEIIDSRAGTGWVVDRIVELHERWKPRGIALDGGGPAASLIPDLQAKDIEPFKLGTREMAQACGAFYDAVAHPATIRHLYDQALTDAVKGAVKRPLGDAWAWSRKDASVDISPLVAVTVALYGLSVIPEEVEGEVWFMN